MQLFLNQVRIVLSRPEGSANVGSVCRAMKNMGITRLTIVQDPALLDTREVRRMALHAFDVYESARFCSDLEEALSGSQLAIAVTRRHGAKRNKKSIPIGELGPALQGRSGGDLAFVFGNEEHGLSNEEVQLCSAKLSIPTSPEFPSMNLAQAVQVVTYELFRAAGTGDGGEGTQEIEALRRDRIEELTGVVMDTLDALGFFKNTDGHYTRQVFRDVFHRAGLRTFEADYIQRVFRKIRYIRREDLPPAD